MKKIYKIEEIPVEENIFLSKDMFGWRVVNPIKNDDGSFNWFNFVVGSWWNIICVVIVCILIGLFYLSYHELSSQLLTCLEQVRPIVIDIPKLILP